MPPLKFTPTEEAILKVLSDGVAHTIRELRACLSDEMAVTSTVHVHLKNLREKLKANRQDIICIYQFGKAPLYRHVVLLPSCSAE